MVFRKRIVQEKPFCMLLPGSGAMEAAMTNLTDPGDPVVVVNAGKFGERWQELAETTMNPGDRTLLQVSVETAAIPAIDP